MAHIQSARIISADSMKDPLRGGAIIGDGGDPQSASHPLPLLSASSPLRGALPGPVDVGGPYSASARAPRAASALLFSTRSIESGSAFDGVFGSPESKTAAPRRLRPVPRWPLLRARQRRYKPQSAQDHGRIRSIEKQKQWKNVGEAPATPIQATVRVPHRAAAASRASPRAGTPTRRHRRPGGRPSPRRGAFRLGLRLGRAGWRGGAPPPRAYGGPAGEEPRSDRRDRAVRLRHTGAPPPPPRLPRRARQHRGRPLKGRPSIFHHNGRLARDRKAGRQPSAGTAAHSPRWRGGRDSDGAKAPQPQTPPAPPPPSATDPWYRLGRAGSPPPPTGAHGQQPSEARDKWGIGGKASWHCRREGTASCLHAGRLFARERLVRLW